MNLRKFLYLVVVVACPTQVVAQYAVPTYIVSPLPAAGATLTNAPASWPCKTTITVPKAGYSTISTLQMLNVITLNPDGSFNSYLADQWWTSPAGTVSQPFASDAFGKPDQSGAYMTVTYNKQLILTTGLPSGLSLKIGYAANNAAGGVVYYWGSQNFKSGGN